MKKLFLKVLLPIAVLAGCYVWMYYHPTIKEQDEDLIFTKLWLLSSGSTIILVLSLLNLILNYILSWKLFPGIRFFLQMVIGTLLSLGCLNYCYLFIKGYYTSSAPDVTQITLMNLYGSAIILPIFSIYFGYQFLKDWRRSELETERLQKENAHSQMMSLKNHLDPHFLFNNLNILSSLMDKDINLSKSYLDKFAEVYRIILKAEYSDLTLLEDELKLIDAYVYLLTIRFGDSVFFDIAIKEPHKQKVLPPLSIQMLIENAIKHNMASAAKPVTIRIYSKQDSVVIENNIQKKKYAVQERKGSGLENIKSRYEFFSDKPVKIEETTSLFKVTLPLLDIDQD